jgi:hypothetical protein
MDANFRSARFFLVALLALSLPSCSKFGRLSPADQVARVNVGAGGGAQGSKQSRTYAPQTGGVVIWATRDDGSAEASALLPSNTATYQMNLTFGAWTFHAAGWDGAQVFQGVTRCGTKQLVVNSGTTDVTIAIDAASCGAIGTPTFFGSNGVQPLKVISCSSLSSVTNNSSVCSGSQVGDLLSFAVEVQGYYPATGSTLTTYQSYTSVCVDMNTTPNGTLLKVPEGASGQSPIFVSVNGFTGAGCTGTQVNFDFPDGLSNPPESGGAALYGGSTKNTLFVVHGPTTPTVTAISPAQGGWGGHTDVTITGTDFDPSAVVKLNGVTCPISAISPAQIHCRPAKTSTLGGFSMVVTNSDGLSGSGSYSYVDDGYGTGTDGNLALTTSILDTSSGTNLAGRPLQAFRSVTNVAANVVTVFNTPTLTNDFVSGDTVLWHVSAMNGGGSCGGSLTVGQFGFAYVQSVVTASGQITLDSTIPGSPPSGYLQQTSRINTNNFCALQLVRVPSLETFTYDPTSAALQVKPPIFSLANGTGGILAITINDTLNVLGGNAADFDASGLGFAGGASGGFQGVGISGFGTTAGAGSNASGGGGGNGSFGAAGGGGYGLGGSGGNDTGLLGGGTGNSSCDPGVATCARLGGGGGGAYTGGSGGAGGGIILIYARKISASGNLTLKANASISVGAGGGGGAGGTAFLRSIDSIGSSLNLKANASPGDGSASTGAAGGGGGVARHRGCAASLASVGTASANAGSGAGTGAPTNGVIGLAVADGATAGAEFCPP